MIFGEIWRITITLDGSEGMSLEVIMSRTMAFALMRDMNEIKFLSIGAYVTFSGKRISTRLLKKSGTENVEAATNLQLA